MKKYVSTILLLIASAQAKEPLSPTVGYLENAVKPCLTDHGKSIAFLSGNPFAPTINILDTTWDHFVTKPYPVLDIGDELACGSNSVIILGKDNTRKLSTQNGEQIDVKHNDIQMKYLHDRIIVGNTLFESDDSTINITSLDSFKQNRKIQWPSGQFYDMREYSESVLYKRQLNSGKDMYFLVDVPTGESRDITSQIGKCSYTSLTKNGNYLHAECSDKENRVFNTKTLERISALEKYLFSIRKDRDQSLSLRFFDQYQNLILIGTEDEFIAWDMESQKPNYIIQSPYMHPSYIHQEGTVLISGINQEPYALLDVKSGNIRYQPVTYNKPYDIFIENGAPKVVLEIDSNHTGIWNLLDHKWEQKLGDEQFFKDFEKAYTTDKYIFYTRSFQKGEDPVRQYSRINGALLHTYPTDTYMNAPKAISADDKYNKLMIHYGTIEGDGFKIFDTENGQLLFDLKSPQKHLKVTSMTLSDDGKKLIVQTAKTKGHVRIEMGESYDYDNEPLILTWDFKTQKVNVEPCGKSCKQPQPLQSLSAKGDGFTVTWDKQHKAIEITKDDNPYRKIYMYMPYGTSEWIDMDNFGYFDAPKGGESYIFMCDDGKCNHIDDAGKRYFKRPGLLEMFLKEKANK